MDQNGNVRTNIYLSYDIERKKKENTRNKYLCKDYWMALFLLPRAALKPDQRRQEKKINKKECIFYLEPPSGICSCHLSKTNKKKDLSSSFSLSRFDKQNTRDYVFSWHRVGLIFHATFALWWSTGGPARVLKESLGEIFFFPDNILSRRCPWNDRLTLLHLLHLTESQEVDIALNSVIVHHWNRNY